MDTIGPLPADMYGNKYIINWVCVASGAVELSARPDTSAKSALLSLIEVDCRHGPPKVIRTDQGSQYNNSLLTDYLAYVNTEQQFTKTPYTPMQVGKVERKNQDAMSHVRALIMNRKCRNKWTQVLPLAQRVVMHTYSRAIGTTPYRYVYGSLAAANHGLLLPSTVPLVSTVEDLIQALDKDLADIVAASVEYRDEYFKSRMKGQPTATTNFAEGSYVMARFPGRAPKLLKWRGPFLVLSRDGNAYHLQDLTTLSNIELDVKFLKSFDAASHSAATLKSIADIDTGEEVIDYIVSYTGNPAKRNSLEFRVHWKDTEPTEDTYHWHRDLSTTAALDIFIAAHPELRTLNR
jgi:hypothetical protein